MKKLSALLIMLMSLLSLTGCVQDTITTVSETKTKVEYATGVLIEVLPLTTAYVGLHNLYLNPLSYASGKWKQDFYQHHDSIKTSYGKIEKLTPPQEFSTSHTLLMISLENTIKLNNITEDTITTGGKITSDMVKQFETANESFQTFLSQVEQLKSFTTQ